MVEVIIQLSILILVATGFAVVGRFIKQPPLIAYIITGILFSLIGQEVTNMELFNLMAQLGIILLLFVAGLKIRFSEFLKIGKQALIVGEGHDIVMAGLGFVIGFFLMGLNALQSFYLGLALTLSSTIVVVKILTQRKEVAAPHGQILLGTMLLQDLVAMASLAIFTSLALGGNPLVEIGFTILKALGLFILFYFVGKYVMNRLFAKVAEHIELVFLLGLTWCFTGVLLSYFVNFSIEIGAFIAGMSIAHLDFSFEIRDKARSLQDFGLLLFFFTIGATTTISKEIFFSWTFLLLTFFVIVATPIISGTIGMLLGFDKKKNFLISVMPTQVSEFSIIVMAIGFKLGQVSEYLFSLVVGITVVTIILSSSVLTSLNPIYKLLEKHLNFLELRQTGHLRKQRGLKNHVVIFGFKKLGENIARHYRKKGKKCVVVEWEPHLVQKAKKLGCLVVYGNAGDSDVWQETRIEQADLLVSTVGENIDDDMALGKWIRKHHPRIVSIAETNTPSEVPQLKKAGYDFVLYQDEAEWRHLKKYLDSGEVKRRLKKKK